MDEALTSFSERRLRTIFGKWSGVTENSAGDAQLPPDADPLYPSLDAEPPEVHRRERELYRPSWDPRDRWRQLRPSQPVHAPPESDLPPQFRYEDLSALENSETMDIDQDRLLNWLMTRFENNLEFKYTGQLVDMTAEQAIKMQEFSPLQILDEQLENLGISSADQSLIEQRRRLLEAAAGNNKPVTSAAGSSETDVGTSNTWEREEEESEVATHQQNKQVVVIVHEAKAAPASKPVPAAAAASNRNPLAMAMGDVAMQPQEEAQAVVTVNEVTTKPPRKRQTLECGDRASESTIECQVEFQHPQHRVAQFGDVPSCDKAKGDGERRKSDRRLRIAEDAV